MKPILMLMTLLLGLPTYAGNLNCESSEAYSVYFYCGHPEAPKTCKPGRLPRYAELVKVVGTRPLLAATFKCKKMKPAQHSDLTEAFRRIGVCSEISRPENLPLDFPSRFGIEIKRSANSIPQTQAIVYDESSEQDAIPLVTIPCQTK